MNKPRLAVNARRARQRSLVLPVVLVLAVMCAGGQMLALYAAPRRASGPEQDSGRRPGLAGVADNFFPTLAGELYQADGDNNVRRFDLHKVELATGKIARVYDLSRGGELLAGVQERKVIPNTEDIGSTNLVVTNLEGTFARQITAETSVFQARWSPQGDQFVYVTRDMRLYLATPDRRVNRLLSIGAVEPSWSADGSRLVYSHFDKPYAGATNYTVGIAVYDLAAQTETVYTSGYDDCNPVFSPDQKRVLFFSSLRTTVASEYILNLADKKLEQITNAGLTNASADKGFIPVHLNALWSGDGRTIVFETRYAEKEVWMLRLNDNAVVESRKLGTGESPRWIVDGKSLRFLDTTEDARKVRKVELE